MLDFFIKEWKYFINILLAVVVVGIGYYEYKHYTPPQPAVAPVIISTDGKPGNASQPQVVYVQGQSTVTREIQYVPKETDPTTGQPEKTDVQFDRRQGKVYVKVNGHEYEVPSTVKENAKFENGKLVVTEETEMHVNITTPKPAYNLGLGWSRNGMAAEANGPLFKNVSWWVYGDRKTIAGGLQFPISK